MTLITIRGPELRTQNFLLRRKQLPLSTHEPCVTMLLRIQTPVVPGYKQPSSVAEFSLVVIVILVVLVLENFTTVYVQTTYRYLLHRRTSVS